VRASGKIFVIGDIHGCLGMLNRLLEKIPWRPGRDELVFLGDYIDRGEDPKGVVDLILDLQRSFPLIHCLKGNHESMLLDYLLGVNRDRYLANHGHITLRSYSVDLENPAMENFPEHVDFFRSLKPLIEVDDYYFVHAGFRPGTAIHDQLEEDLFWIREPFLSTPYDFGRKVIFGHTPFVEPLVAKNKIGIDTGAVFGNKLTCIELPDERFYSVKA
jgi:serine/threonine protein phosphatase 1